MRPFLISLWLVLLLALGAGTASAKTLWLCGPGVADDPPASVSTRWIAVPGLYRAKCRREDGAVWLGVTPAAGDSRSLVTESIGLDWGLHLYDVNLPLGNLVDVVRRQSRAYARL